MTTDARDYQVSLPPQPGLLSTVARCTVLLLKSYRELPHDTVPCYSAPSVLQCTCSHTAPSTTFCFSLEETCHHPILLVWTWHMLLDLLCHQSGTHLPTCHPYLSEPLSTVDVGM